VHGLMEPLRLCARSNGGFAQDMMMATAQDTIMAKARLLVPVPVPEMRAAAAAAAGGWWC